MKYFMVCINAECNQHVHAVSDEELILAEFIKLPVIASVDGDEPPVKAAVTALEYLLESDLEDKMKYMAYEKLKSLQAQLMEDCPCPSCTEPKTSEGMDGIPIAPSDDYYQSAEYKAHRVRMEELEFERTKAEILNQQAQTVLLDAKARLTVAEAVTLEEKFRISQIKYPQVK